jgi:hypothetical protein
MALSMEEQRILAEIERGLADEDPLLAARLSAFKHPGIAITLRLRRARLLASVASVIAVAAVSIVAYLFVPFAHRAPARSEVPGAPAITETGARASPGTTTRQSGQRSPGARQNGPGSSMGPATGPTKGASRTPVSGRASPAASGAAGSTQNRPAPRASNSPAVSRSANVWPAGTAASSAPGK